MKRKFLPTDLPTNAIFLACSSHEERCLGIVRNWSGWRPDGVILYHYDDPNPRREDNHNTLRTLVMDCCRISEIALSEQDIAASFAQTREEVSSLLSDKGNLPFVVDISVLTKRHLLMLLRWLDDRGLWDRIWIVYTEPEEYEIEGNLPLSFGISRVEQVPGFSASPDASRPLHVVMFLGYEGDRAYATYELLQPQKTTAIIPDPPFRATWQGRTQEQNRNLLAVIGEDAIEKADSIDPDSSLSVLKQILGDTSVRSSFSRVLCPLGTKPQIVGAYMYLRLAVDPPAVVYTGALRHNHSFYSRGVGNSWLIYRPS